MNRILISVFTLSILACFSCSKSETADTPTACFSMSGLDSSKVAGLSQVTIDSIIKTNAPGYFSDIPEGTSTKVYKRVVIFRYCGSVTKFRAIYTGDPSHIYVDPSNPGSVTTAQAGVDFSKDYFVYTYPASGTYMPTVVTTDVSSTGKDLKRAVVSKTIVLQ